MRNRVLPFRPRRHHFPSILIGAAILGCTVDAPTAVSPSAASHATTSAVAGASTLTVGSSAELVAALTPGNAGARIHLRAGSYTVDHPLTVPDGAELEGEGVMQYDEAGRPTGFTPGTRTTVTMIGNVPGNVFTLGNGVTLRRIAIEDLAGRAGNAVGVVSRGPGDLVSATIVETELANPNRHGNVPQGPTGCGLAAYTLNRDLGGGPPPDEGATIAVSMARSLVYAPAAGSCGLFAFNFAARGDVSVSVAESVIGGGVIANGGVSRPDAVHDAHVRVQSRHTLYRQDYADACADVRLGWNLTGGSGSPLPLSLPATERNALAFHSEDDRIEGFTTAVFAIGARRFFDAAIHGASNGNEVDLQMLRTTIVTPPCGRADLQLVAALSSGAFWPGDGNRVRALLRGVTGSGTRANVYANVLVGGAPPPGPAQAGGNRLEITGSPQSFVATNTGIAPAPGREFFTALPSGSGRTP